jgi:hypothetical protein
VAILALPEILELHQEGVQVEPYAGVSCALQEGMIGVSVELVLTVLGMKHVVHYHLHIHLMVVADTLDLDDLVRHVALA